MNLKIHPAPIGLEIQTLIDIIFVMWIILLYFKQLNSITSDDHYQDHTDKIVNAHGITAASDNISFL